MPNIETFPIRRAAKQHVTVALDEDEYVPTQGDRRAGTAREAVITSYHLEYDWDFGQDAWVPNPYRSNVSIRQRLLSGEWGETKMRRGAGIPDAVFAEYRPTSRVRLESTE